MTKLEFLYEIRNGLMGLPLAEIEERVAFLSEMIDDLTEDGLSEEEAVAAMGTVDEIVSKAIADTPITKIATERIKKKRRLKAWEIVLLILGSPIWLSLLIVAFAVILSVYIVLWAVIISLWAAFASLAACAFGGIACGGILAISGDTLPGIAIIGAGILCAGLSVFTFFGCKAATKGIILLTKKLAIWTKCCFIKKEDV